MSMRPCGLRQQKTLYGGCVQQGDGTHYTFEIANPFVDVPADSWAYRSVVELAEAGVIQGVDGTYFQGNRSITR